jgi:GntR family transcriptional regulator of arabinose operon
MTQLPPDLSDLSLDGKDPPKYEQLKNGITAAILSGRLQPGELLPPEKVLAASLGIARNTVRQALQELEKRGLLQRIHGRGTFVDTNALRLLRNGSDGHLEIYALVVPETQGGFYPSLLHGYEKAAHERNHQVIVCSSQNDLDKQAQVILSLMDKHVAGVTIVPAATTPTPSCHVRQLQQQDIPVVLCHRGVARIKAPLLSLPFREIGRCAASAAIDFGHRQAAFFTSSLSESAHQFEKGLRETLVAAGGALPSAFVVFQDTIGRPSDQCEQELQIKLCRLCEHSNRPTVIFTSFDTLAELIYLPLRRLGMRIPDDISLVGFGGALRNGAIISRLSSVVVDQSETARRAVALLDEMRSGVRSITDDETIQLQVALGSGTTLNALGSPESNS